MRSLRTTAGIAVAVAALASGMLAIAAPGQASAAPWCDRPDPPPVCDHVDPPEPGAAVTGHLDEVSADPAGIRVRGWAYDPDGAGPVRVTIGLGSRTAEAIADQPRPDVDTAVPGAGPARGFDVVLPRPANSRQQLCATGRGTGPGPASTVLGCRDWLEQRNAADPSESIGVLVANMQGTDSTVAPWRDRYERVGSWMRDSQTVPDVLVLQEVPGSKCYFASDCSPRDYEALFGLIRGIADTAGVTYRIAHLSTEYIGEGVNPLQQGRAVLYNPQRLRNVTRTPVDLAAFDTPMDDRPHPRRSHPCLNPPTAWASDCRLVDFGTGAHWAARGLSHARFELTAHPGLPFDVVDMHADTDDPGLMFTSLMQRLLPAVGSARDPLYPPIVAGDFNAREPDLLIETAPGGKLTDLGLLAAVPHPDVMAVMAGDAAAFPSLRRPLVAEARTVPSTPPTPGLACGPDAGKWSDHCAKYVRLSPA